LVHDVNMLGSCNLSSITMRAFSTLNWALTLALMVIVVSCDYEDDDDCHTHYYSTGVIISHCHDDDDFDDDDFDDDDFDDDIVHLSTAPAEVTVLVTDEPRSGLQAVHVTITGVTLLSPEVKPQAVYASEAGRRLELLSLREEGGTRLYEVLSGRTAVVPAAYEGVRLQLAAPSLGLASGEAVEPAAIDCPAGCAVEVPLAEPLLVGPGELATLVVDVLVERSLEPPGAGGSTSRWTLRPAVVVQTFREAAAQAIATPLEVQGLVREVDAPASRLRLELEDGAGVLDVDFGAEAELFAGDLGRVTLADVEPGERLSVRGILASDGSLAARSAFVGATFRRRGILREVRPGDRGLRLVLEDEAAHGRFELDVFDEAFVTQRRTLPLELHRAQPGQIATITGIQSAPGEQPRAVRIDLDSLSVPAAASER
jgi:hypothetical protein